MRAREAEFTTARLVARTRGTGDRIGTYQRAGDSSGACNGFGGAIDRISASGRRGTKIADHSGGSAAGQTFGYRRRKAGTLERPSPRTGLTGGRGPGLSGACRGPDS